MHVYLHACTGMHIYLYMYEYMSIYIYMNEKTPYAGNLFLMIFIHENFNSSLPTQKDNIFYSLIDRF